jgi:hypothetical protein
MQKCRGPWGGNPRAPCVRGSLKLPDQLYPHHPQPKEAVNRMQNINVPIKYLSSNAMIVSFF